MTTDMLPAPPPPSVSPITPSTGPQETPTYRELLPELFTRPMALIWAWVVPAWIMLGVNVGYWNLLSEEAGPQTHSMALAWLAAGLANIAIGTGIFWRHHTRHLRLDWKSGLAATVTQVTYLIFTTQTVSNIVSSGVGPWIASENSVSLHQFTFAMPAVFYGTLLIAAQPARWKRPKDIGLSILSFIVAPGVFYCSVMLGSTLFRNLWIGPVFAMLALGCAGILMGLGALRFALNMATFEWTRRAAGRTVLSTLVALVLPLIGLFLNSTITFPADFQSPWVYGFMLVNALVLLCPVFASHEANALLLFARGATLPFTLYFFVVFLPLLPLSIPAMFFFGAGILMLAPTFLLLLHAWRLVDCWKAGMGIRMPAAVLLGLAAFSLVPAWLARETFAQRAALLAALDYVYSPDPTQPRVFAGDTARVAASLRWLQDYKHGKFYPYLTPIRNHVLFDSMTLPDSKIERLYHIFTGEQLPSMEWLPRFGAPFYGNTQARQNRSGNTRPLPHSVRLVRREARLIETPADSSRAGRLTLNIEGSVDQRDEYVTWFDVPEGALVSGLWLDIEGETVPGRIFERRAATFVYENIRDVQQRDPALVRYRADGRVELRVFPIANGEQRRVELEFLFPSGAPLSVRQDDALVSFGDADAAQANAQPLTGTGDGRHWFYLPAEWLAAQPSARRNWSPVVILDHSVNGLSPAEAAAALSPLAAMLPDAAAPQTLAVNYDATPVNGIRSLTAAGAALPKPGKGGFLPGPAAARVAWEAAKVFQEATPSLNRLQSCPLFIIAARNESAAIEVLDALRPWREFFPDNPGVIFAPPAGEPRLLGFDGSQRGLGAEAPMPDPAPITLVSFSGQMRPASTDGNGALISFAVPKDGDKPLSLSVRSPQGGPAQEMSVRTLAADEPYSRGASVFSYSLRPLRYPPLGNEELPLLVNLSRSTGILIPQTAYIVVENSWQWSELKAQQQRVFAGRTDLDLAETPEPAAWLLGIAVIAWIAIGARRHHIPSRDSDSRA